MGCLFGHKWDGCVCKKCAKSRHYWINGKCDKCGENIFNKDDLKLIHDACEYIFRKSNNEKAKSISQKTLDNDNFTNEDMNLIISFCTRFFENAKNSNDINMLIAFTNKYPTFETMFMKIIQNMEGADNNGE